MVIPKPPGHGATAPPPSGTGTASFGDIPTTKSALELQQSLLSQHKVVSSLANNPSHPPLPPSDGFSDSSGARAHSEPMWHVYLILFGGPTLGYHLGISGGVSSMAPFLEAFFPEVHRNEASTNQYCKFNSQKLQLFTSSLYLAAFIASFCTSWIIKKFGHRKIMIMVGFLFSVGAVLTSSALNIAMLIGGRFLIGIAIGFANQSMPMYISEMSPHKYRRHFSILFQLTITFGILQAHVFNKDSIHFSENWGWRVSLGGGVSPLLIMLSFFLIDTPSCLVERGKNEEAKALLKRIRGIKVDVEAEFNDMVATMKEARLVQNPWNNLVNKECYRPQFAMSILIPLFHQFTGINVILFYAPVLFKIIGFKHDTYFIVATITVIVYLLASTVSIYGSDRWGRRSLFLGGGIQMFIFQIGAAVLIKWRFRVSTDIPSWFAEAVVTCICIYMVTFPWSWGALGWLYPSEIFPLDVRRAAQSITVAVNMFAAFIMSQFFLSMFCTVQFGIFIFFAFFFVMMTIYCNFFMPEMKNIPSEKMTQVWREHWFWRKFMSDLNDPTNKTIDKQDLLVQLLITSPIEKAQLMSVTRVIDTIF